MSTTYRRSRTSATTEEHELFPLHLKPAVTVFLASFMFTFLYGLVRAG